MTKHTGKIWIEHNPHTGEARPFEVWFHAVSLGCAPKKIAHCATREGAERSVKGTIKRNAGWYEMEVGA